MPQHPHLGRLTRSAELATGTEKMQRGMRRYSRRVGSHHRVHLGTARPGRFRVVSHQLRTGVSHGALHFLQVRVSAIARASNGCFSATTY